MNEPTSDNPLPSIYFISLLIGSAAMAFWKRDIFAGVTVAALGVAGFACMSQLEDWINRMKP